MRSWAPRRHTFRIFYRRKVPHDILGRHRLTGTAFTADHNRLILAVADHAAIRIFCDGKQVRFQFSPASSCVRLNDFRAVQVQVKEWVHSNQHNTRIGIDRPLLIPVEDGM